MKTWLRSAAVAVLLVAVAAPSISNRVEAEDLREAIAPDVFLAVYGKHNPERDYQREHLRAVWKAVEDSRIIDRVVRIVQSRMSDDDVAGMLKVRDSLKQALDPVQWSQLAQCSEIAYGQKFSGPFTQNVLLLRFPDESADSLMQGVRNLLTLADEAADGELDLQEESIGEAKLLSLKFPAEVPLSPTVGVKGDLFIYSSHPDMARQALSLLSDPSAPSKFEDEKLKAALTHLPEPEDALVYFDGQELFKQLDGLVQFIRGVGAGNREALRAAEVIESIIAEVNILDYEVTVEHTDGYRNLSTALGKTRDGYQTTVLGKMVSGQQSFEDWSKWVPADANSFSLNTGLNLHPFYEWLTTRIPQIIPESQEVFDKLEAAQQNADLHVDKDLLQSFSGECVSISLPGPITPFGQSSKSVFFAKCNNADRVKELIHRGIDALNQIPQVQAQGLSLRESQNLEGFEEVNAGIFAMMGGLTPVVGFRDGWMIVGSHVDAVEKVLLTKGGESPSIVTADRFQQFGLEVEGTVHSISYRNTGETIRQIGQSLQQVGAMLPMFIAMAGQQGENAPDLSAVQDVLQLLPSVGRIVAKFDFIDATLNVTQPGPMDGTYLRRTVVKILPPATTAEASDQN